LRWMRANPHAQFLDGWSPGYSVHRVYTEASARGTVRLPAIMMLTLEPESLKNQLATTRHQTKITSDRLPDCTRCILRYFLNKSFSVTRWPVSNVDVVDSVICCPSAETSHLSV
jgi:hypothetical protein